MLEFVPNDPVLVLFTSNVEYHVTNHSTDELCQMSPCGASFPIKR
jgi:hypothetical protein